MKKCKITVLRREFYQDLADKYIPFPDFKPCEMMKEGDVFVTTGPFGTEMPEHFCAAAWDAIKSHAVVLASGGKVYQHDDVHIACCNDGVRPVIFRLEGIEDGTQMLF